MKTVAQMTLPEWHAAVQAESAVVASELAAVADALPSGADDTQTQLIVAITFLAKERELDLPSEFWAHFEVVTGRKVDADKRYSFFSCSC